jgi:hypothetical protein
VALGHVLVRVFGAYQSVVVSKLFIHVTRVMYNGPIRNLCFNTTTSLTTGRENNITYIYIYIKTRAETWCLKAKTVEKLNSTEMDFWRRSARISRKDKIRNNVIKQKMNITRFLLEGIKTKQLKLYGHVQRMDEGRLPK